MANLNTPVNIEEASEFRGQYEIIPPGEYLAVYLNDILEPNKNGTGEVLKIKFELQDGSKRTVTANLNYSNPSVTATAIGRGELAKIAQSIGHNAPVYKTEVLFGRPLTIKIIVEEFLSNKDGRALKSNKIADYKPASAAKPATAAAVNNKVW